MVKLLLLVATVLTAAALGALWYLIGGLPRDHERYGAVGIPGKRTLKLPKGEVRLSFEGQATGGGDNRHLEDPPEGLRVRVARRGGKRLEVTEVPSWLFSSISGDRGDEPYGRIQLPERGRYRVRTRATGASPNGEITLGPKPWNPLGSRLAGPIVAGVVALLALLLLSLPLVLLLGRDR